MGGTRTARGKKGARANYLTRGQALRRLQISLKDFRRLCILKGIYPRDPKNKPMGNSRVYFLKKDVQFLAHEPILNKYREMKVFLRKYRKAIARREQSKAERLEETMRPEITLDHLVKERYPTFVDALKELDDGLTMVFMFAALPSMGRVHSDSLQMCIRLSREFMLYCTEARCLRKAFVSVKGIYYQAEILGQKITWVVPFRFTNEQPEDVDFNVMETFLQFYETLLKFVNFRLYHSLNLRYPPQLSEAEEAADAGLGHVVKDEVEAATFGTTDTDATRAEQEDAAAGDNENDDFADTEEGQAIKELRAREERLRTLFEGCVVFCSRETPVYSLEFVLRSFGARVGWQAVEGSPFDATDEAITHHIVDRPNADTSAPGRDYVQPQWVYDSINAGVLLPVHEYAPGADLPPHLSPFVNDEAVGYVPERRKQIERIAARAEGRAIEADDEDNAAEAAVDSDAEADEAEFRRELEAEAGATERGDDSEEKAKVVDMPKKLTKRQLASLAKRDGAIMEKIMMKKRDRKLYTKIAKGEERRAAKVRKLTRKAEIIKERKRANKQ